MRRWTDISAETTFRDRNLFLKNLVVGPEIAVDVLNLDASRLDENQLGLGFEGTLFQGRTKLAAKVDDLNDTNKLALRLDVTGLSLHVLSAYLNLALPVQAEIPSVHVAFDGGRMTSDAGVLVLAEIERKLGLADRLAGCLEDPRAPERVHHGLAEMIRFRALMIAAGYEDANDCNALRDDPAFKMAVGRLPETGAELCSQPTMCRLENLPTTTALKRMMAAMVELFCDSFEEVPRRIVLGRLGLHGGRRTAYLRANGDVARLAHHRRGQPPVDGVVAGEVHVEQLRHARFDGRGQSPGDDDFRSGGSVPVSHDAARYPFAMPWVKRLVA